MTVARAGDVLGAAGIQEVMTELEPQRLVDGWGILDSPEVVQSVRDAGIGLDVCLSRAIRAGLIGAYSDYPLQRIFDEDLRVSVSSELPRLYGSSLSDEYQAVVESCGFGMDELEEIALNGLRNSFLEAEAKQALITEFEQEYALLRDKHLTETAH